MSERDIVERLRMSAASTEVHEICEPYGAILDHAADEIERLREALRWYGENARLCRLIHSEGDAGRHALNDDGGKRARTALEEPKP